MYRVMIVDDEDYVRDLLVKNIRSSSLAVEVVAVAGDGKRGFKISSSFKTGYFNHGYIHAIYEWTGAD